MLKYLDYVLYIQSFLFIYLHFNNHVKKSIANLHLK